MFEEAELIPGVKEPPPEQVAMLGPQHLVFTYLRLAADPESTDRLCASGVTCVAYETVVDEPAHANDTIYWLAGSIWTSKGARALRVARALRAETLVVNSYTPVRLGTPFGGFKQSGVGRELGPDVANSYTELKNGYCAAGV